MANVLLADDSVTIHKVVEIILTAKGFTLKAVADGEKALEVVKDFKPDVVLADIDMPGLSGYDLAKKITSDPSTQDIPVILLAGAFESIDDARAQDSGASGTLIKPFESEDLVGKITQVLSPEAAFEAAKPQPQESGEVLEVEGLEAVGQEPDEEFMDFGEAAGDEEPALEAFEPFEEITEKPEAEEAEALSEAETEEELIAVEAAEELTPLEAEAEEAAPALEKEFAAAEVAGEAAFEEEEGLTPVEPWPEEAELRASSAGVPDSQAASEAFMKILDEKISEAVDGMDLRSALMETIAPNLAEAIEKVLWEIVPELTEKLSKEILAESMKDLKKELEQVIWETVPEVAEKIISKEIQRIREES